MAKKLIVALALCLGALIIAPNDSCAAKLGIDVELKKSIDAKVIEVRYSRSRRARRSGELSREENVGQFGQRDGELKLRPSLKFEDHRSGIKFGENPQRSVPTLSPKTAGPTLTPKLN